MATKVVAGRVVRKLSFEDVLCPICRTIYIEPVSLPCKHVVCKQCLEKTVESNTLACPICRTRIGSFLRLSRVSGKLVDEGLWQEMKEQFAQEIKMKQNGEEDGISDRLMETQRPPKKLAEKGSIRQEFEEMLQKLKKEDEHNRLAEESASKELAKKLMAQELEEETNRKRKQEEIVEADIIFIKKFLLTEKGDPQTPSSKLVRSKSVQENQSCSNGRDSITAELRHFTPICIMPKTPPKRLPNGKIQEAKLFKPINMAVSLDDNDSSISHQKALRGSSLKVYSNNFVPTKSDDDVTPDDDSSNSITSPSLTHSETSVISPELIKTQELIQTQIEQEQQDFALALKLQAEWDSELKLPKRNHSYMLRSAKKYRR